MSKVFKINKYPENTLIRNDMGAVDYFDSYMTVKKTTDSDPRNHPETTSSTRMGQYIDVYKRNSYCQAFWFKDWKHREK